tara:strand:+ start:252 stop:629 length:378 start_codon:yes stop_codon:yes gene_type:complete
MIHIEKNWKNVKCSPLVILSNKLINYNNNNDVLRNCLGNVENEIYSNINNTYNNMIIEIDDLVKDISLNDSEFIESLNEKYKDEFIKIQNKVSNIDDNKKNMEKKLDDNNIKLDATIKKIDKIIK